jgi:uncharacterized protein YbbC (DUF1343 family)
MIPTSRYIQLAVILLALGSVGGIPRAQEEPKTPVLFGIDVLEAQGFGDLKGKQVGLITNQTGVDSRERSTADVLARAPGVRLVALFSPEHGIRGTAKPGEPIGDAIDSKTHLPVYSLYGNTQRPTPEMLNAIDTLVFDLQDVGVRFYTYLATMGMAMEEAARRGIDFVVLDRPNPLGGIILEGEVLEPRFRHFTAYFQVPVRHGFTAGEMAQWYNQTARLNLRLKVVPMIGWRRSEFWSDVGHPFIAPSPNIRTPMEALLYTGIGMFETTNVAVGRGTPVPFEQFGAPWLDGPKLVRRLNALGLPGVQFESTLFFPTEDLYQGQRCSGVRMTVTDTSQLRPVDIFVQVMCILRDYYPLVLQIRWEEVARLTGSDDFEHLYKAGNTAAEIIDVFDRNATLFASEREKYLLY